MKAFKEKTKILKLDFSKFSSFYLFNSLFKDSSHQFFADFKHNAPFKLYKIFKFLFYPLSLHRQKPCFHLNSCNKSSKVSNKTHQNMKTYILKSSKSKFSQFMSFFKQSKKPFYRSSQFIDLLKAFFSSYSRNNGFNFRSFFKIETRSIGTFPAYVSKDTAFPFSAIKPTSKLKSFSFFFISPVDQLYTSFANKLSRRDKIDFSFFKGIRVLSSWIRSNVRKNIFFKKELNIGKAIVSCICKKGFNFFLFVFKEFESIFSEIREMISVPGVSRSNFVRDRNRKGRGYNFEMDFVAEEAEIFRFIAPASRFIRGKGGDMGAIDGKVKVFSFNKGDSLANIGKKYIREDIFRDSFSEVVEGVVVRSFSEGETAEIGESDIVAEFSCKIPFRFGKAEIDEKECFKKRFWGIRDFLEVGVVGL